MTFSIIPPTNMTNLFGNWLHGVNTQDKVQIRVGACALLWDIWNTRNDIIFNRSKQSSFFQVIPLASHKIRMWSCLQPEELRQDMVSRCNRLKTVALDLFNRRGWQHVARISAGCLVTICIFLLFSNG
jgi:hypothetical protein